MGVSERDLEHKGFSRSLASFTGVGFLLLGGKSRVASTISSTCEFCTRDFLAAPGSWRHGQCTRAEDLDAKLETSFPARVQATLLMLRRIFNGRGARAITRALELLSGNIRDFTGSPVADDSYDLCI